MPSPPQNTNLPPTFSDSNAHGNSLRPPTVLHSANPQAHQSVDTPREPDASTSIFRKGNEKALSSIYHVNEPSGGSLHSVYEQSDPSRRRGDDTADERRYTYIRRLIKERQAKEREEARRTGGGIPGRAGARASGSGLSTTQQKVTAVKTGGGFRRFSYTKAVRKMLLDKRAQYKNISMKDRDFFIGLVERYAKNKTVGQGFSRMNRMSMRMEVERARRKGQISFEDSRDFKKLIDQM